MMGIIKTLKICQNLYQEVVCPCPGAIYMFDIEKKSLSLPAQDQVSGERYKTVGPLLFEISSANENSHAQISRKAQFKASRVH